MSAQLPPMDEVDAACEAQRRDIDNQLRCLKCGRMIEELMRLVTHNNGREFRTRLEALSHYDLGQFHRAVIKEFGK